MTPLRLGTLGALALHDGERTLAATRRKELALLAYIARRSPRAVARPELLALLWGDRPEENARLSLRQALLRLRRLVGDGLVVTAEEVRLAPGALTLDVVDFERDVAEGRHLEAVARWQGDFLAPAEDAGGESFRAWVEGERAALRSLLAVACRRVVDDAATRGAWTEAVAVAERWTTFLPDDERAHKALAESLLMANRAAEALARHAAFVASRDAAPGADLARLGDRLARAASAPPPNPGSAGLFSPDMVGREDAHAELVAAWRRARDGAATIAVVEGDAGIGKTRLLEEFLRAARAERRAHVLLHARAWAADERAPLSTARELFAPLERAPGLAGAAPAHLAELARLLPALRDRFPHLPAVAETGAAPAADALAAVLADVAAEAPVLVALDDVAAADDASRRLLIGVARRLRDAAVLVVLTTRSGELGAADLRDAHPRWLRLQPLDERAVAALVASMLAMDAAEREALATRLLAERGGNPLEIVESIASLVDEGHLAPDATGRWRLAAGAAGGPLPVAGTALDSVRRRIARLPHEAARALDAAAARRGRFEAARLASATGIPVATTVDALDRLVAARLIRPSLAGGTFEIANETVRAAARARTAEPARPRGRRRMLVAAAAFAIAASTLLLLRREPAFARSEVPLVAIAGVWETRGDSADAWLTDGVPRLIEAGLSRASEVAVVPVEQVAAVRARARIAPGVPLADERALDLGRRLGATWVVRGTITRADTLLLLDLRLHATRDGRLLRQAVIPGRDIFALADAATARILALADARRDGPRLAELETSSAAAYEHFIRAVRAGAAGRGTEEVAALDAAIALDSAFGSALLLRAERAWAASDTATQHRMSELLRRHRARLSARDRLQWEVVEANRRGERARAMALLRELVDRYPRDPRGLAQLADRYYAEGRWTEYRALLRQTLALDSLGVAAGDGPCVPCVTYGRLVEIEWALGRREDAERTARRWVQVQPGAANAHHHLAKVLARRGRGDEAVAHIERAVSLAGNDPAQQLSHARVLVTARRYDAADAIVREWERAAAATRDEALRAQLRVQAADLRSVLALERGQLRRGIADIERTVRGDPRAGWLDAVRGAMLARLGRFDDAAAVHEALAHRDPALPMDAVAARTWAWQHALLADAVAPAGDTVRLRALADSIARVATGASTFARDWRLHHHVRGLIAMRGGRWAEAERELQAARWGIGGWTRTVAELARAQLAQGRPLDAVHTLRDAYEYPDAMVRYHAVSETDWLMAQAFRAAGQHDSAAVYREHARRAWREADPEIRQRLEAW